MDLLIPLYFEMRTPCPYRRLSKIRYTVLQQTRQDFTLYFLFTGLSTTGDIKRSTCKSKILGTIDMKSSLLVYYTALRLQYLHYNTGAEIKIIYLS